MLAHKLAGPTAHAVVVQLDAGQTAWCEAGRLVWKTANVGLRVQLSGPAGPNVLGVLGRAVTTAVGLGRRRLAGERPAYHHLTAVGGSGLAAFAAPSPGQLRELRLDGGRGWLVARGALVVAEATIGPDLGTTLLGLVHREADQPELEGLAGTGSLFVAAAGSFLELDPGRFGGEVQVDAARLVAVQEGVGITVERVGALPGPELLASVLGGEPAVLATLSGAGLVLLQSAAPTRADTDRAGGGPDRPVPRWLGGDPG
ncbi:MAG TPA: AIM24 family protein [Actinomycetes bacterium]|jgi:uncharacterized protein (AIM24 family)|nr:AIM24 family protein [Actinomycetes bacterium]